MPPSRASGGAPSADDFDDCDVEVRRIHPFQARKAYLCPGCQQELAAGLGHVVVVPRRQPELRRHWHLSCWEHRHRRHPGR